MSTNRLASTPNGQVSIKSQVATKGDLLQASKAVYDQLRKDLDLLSTENLVKLGSSLDKRLERALLKDMERHVKAIQNHYEQKALELEQKHQQQVSFLQQVFETTVRGLQSYIERLSFPCPEVKLNVPDTLKMQLPDVIVNVPQAGVTVSVPEQKPPDVIVQVPKRKVTKHIEYDQHGRPATVREEEN